MSDKKVALITGCSSGGLGAALAIALHKAGYRVIATARNTKKLEETDAAGIEHLQLDVTSPTSIAECVKSLESLTGRLDLLINNAGSGHPMPVLDIDLDDARKVFDLNVFSLVSVSRAFLPLLMKSLSAMIANNISVGAYLTLPVNGLYNSSKAAANTLTDTLRLELLPFGIKVIALMTGSVQSNFFKNLPTAEIDSASQLPEDSIYRIVPGGLKMMTNTEATINDPGIMDAQTWAEQVVGDLVQKSPPHQIWRGSYVSSARFALHLPTGWLDRPFMKKTGMDEVERAVAASKQT